jgi:hypothetical protein
MKTSPDRHLIAQEDFSNIKRYDQDADLGCPTKPRIRARHKNDLTYRLATSENRLGDINLGPIDLGFERRAYGLVWNGTEYIMKAKYSSGGIRAAQVHITQWPQVMIFAQGQVEGGRAA